jgi:hypothetical protein
MSSALKSPITDSARALSYVAGPILGAGKSGLTEVLEQLTSPEDVVLLTWLTPQSPYSVDPGFLDQRLVIVEGRYGSMEADYSIRVRQSRKKLIAAAPRWCRGWRGPAASVVTACRPEGGRAGRGRSRPGVAATTFARHGSNARRGTPSYSGSSSACSQSSASSAGTCRAMMRRRRIALASQRS